MASVLRHPIFRQRKLTNKKRYSRKKKLDPSHTESI